MPFSQPLDQHKAPVPRVYILSASHPFLTHQQVQTPPPRGSEKLAKIWGCDVIHILLVLRLDRDRRDVTLPLKNTCRKRWRRLMP